MRRPPATPLTGGVSSDIWRIDLPAGPVCVKRALAKLRVAADWQAPVGRNLYEARWMRRANAAGPGAAPALLGQDHADRRAGDGSTCRRADHPLWKAQLRDGHADPGLRRRASATVLARIHAATAADPAVAADFPTDAIFHAIRLEPYLLATARAHPDRAAAAATRWSPRPQANKRALVHGDVSPKNILCGPAGPVFLDAECAWWGDPAFDLAFCLNHLLLKCLWTPAAATGLPCLLRCAGRRLSAPASPGSRRRRWKPAPPHLLPGLLLARVDGKSPVEYITAEADKDRGPPRRPRAARAPPVAGSATCGPGLDRRSLRH